MQNRLFALSLLVTSLFVACSGQGPELAGFFSGGLIGLECPPGSSPDGTCGNPDCTVACVATTPCTAQTACPLGSTCDASPGDPYCLPTLCNDASPECASGAYCARQGLSKGICVVVDPTPTPCPAGTLEGLPCDWPFVCNGGSCKLPCDSSACPTGTACVEGSCEGGG
jgi:hypothetical protein